MFFVLSKIASVFLVPSNACLFGAACGAALLWWRDGRLGRRLLTACLVLLFLAGFSPLGNLLLAPLENRFPSPPDAGGEPTGIVVLGGAFDTIVAEARGEPSLNAAADRMTALGELARRYPSSRIIFSGGSGHLIPTATTEAQLADELSAMAGILAGRIEYEGRSRNTAENAQFSRMMANPAADERWWLLTSAFHMPRAIGAFRNAGFPVEAYPVDWRTTGGLGLRRPFSTASEGLAVTDVAVREWIGLLAYWLTGRSAELFPGPSPEP